MEKDKLPATMREKREIMGSEMRKVNPRLLKFFCSLACLQVIFDMATENEIVSQAVKGALEQIQQNAPEEFSKMNVDPKDAITEAARAAATEEVKLAHEFSSRPDQDIRERLAKYLPEDRIKLIEEALRIPTFRMEITQKSDGKYLVQMTTEGKEFLPGKELATVTDIQWASILQEASILVEAILLVMSAVGVNPSVSQSTMTATIEDTAEAIENSSALQRAIAKFISSWHAAGGSAYQRAKAIFILLKESYAAGIVWTIIKSLCREMKRYDWLETAAKVTAMIIAALATEGAALIARIALVVMSAVDFIRKLANLVKLEEIKQNM